MIGRNRNELGQGTSEYIIVVALIGIAAIGVVSLFGENLRAVFATATNALGGNTSERTKSQQAHQRHTRKRTLGDFMQDNGGGS
jgi:pilus assembly protein Flp/PilA